MGNTLKSRLHLDKAGQRSDRLKKNENAAPNADLDSDRMGPAEPNRAARIGEPQMPTNSSLPATESAQAVAKARNRN